MKHLLLLIISLSTTVSFAQDIAMQVVASAGGYYTNTGAGLSISWTLGEVATSTLTTAEYTVTQGFQQGDLFATAVEKPELTKADLKIYPNPATVEFFIEMSAAKGKAWAEVFDITGRKLIKKELNLEENTPFKIPITDLKSGIYMVKVTVESTNATKVIKLIKE